MFYLFFYIRLKILTTTLVIIRMKSTIFQTFTLRTQRRP